MYQSGRAGDEAKKRKSPAKSGRVGITVVARRNPWPPDLNDSPVEYTVTVCLSNILLCTENYLISHQLPADIFDSCIFFFLLPLIN